MPENREAAGTQRKANGQFAKGVSGNPAGRKKKPPELERYAKKGIKELYAIAEDKSTSKSLRADIWKWFAEWEYGKPTQKVALEEGSAPIVSVQISDELKDYAG